MVLNDLMYNEELYEYGTTYHKLYIKMKVLAQPIQVQAPRRPTTCSIHILLHCPTYERSSECGSVSFTFRTDLSREMRSEECDFLDCNLHALESLQPPFPYSRPCMLPA